MSTLQFAAPSSAAVVLTTELNSLANAGTSALGPAWDNRTTRYKLMAIEVVLASLTPTTGAQITVYAVAATDGTNYGDITPATQVMCDAPSTSASAKRITTYGIPAGPFLVKFALRNDTGVALAAGSNTVKVWGYNEELV